MDLAGMVNRAMDRVMEKVDPRPRDDAWAEKARAQYERGEPPVGKVETQWYGLFQQEKEAEGEAEKFTALDDGRVIGEAGEPIPGLRTEVVLPGACPCGTAACRSGWPETEKEAE